MKVYNRNHYLSLSSRVIHKLLSETKKSIYGRLYWYIISELKYKTKAFNVYGYGMNSTSNIMTIDAYHDSYDVFRFYTGKRKTIRLMIVGPDLKALGKALTDIENYLGNVIKIKIMDKADDYVYIKVFIKRDIRLDKALDVLLRL